MEDIIRKCNLIVDLSKFTSNKKILEELSLSKFIVNVKTIPSKLQPLALKFLLQMKLESEKLNEFHQIEKPSQRERERESKLVQYYAWFEPSSQNRT